MAVTRAGFSEVGSFFPEKLRFSGNSGKGAPRKASPMNTGKRKIKAFLYRKAENGTVKKHSSMH
jgi:hypothetical protein